MMKARLFIVRTEYKRSSESSSNGMLKSIWTYSTSKSSCVRSPLNLCWPIRENLPSKPTPQVCSEITAASLLGSSLGASQARIGSWLHHRLSVGSPLKYLIYKRLSGPLLTTGHNDGRPTSTFQASVSKVLHGSTLWGFLHANSSV